VYDVFLDTQPDGNSIMTNFR